LHKNQNELDRFAYIVENIIMKTEYTILDQTYTAEELDDREIAAADRAAARHARETGQPLDQRIRFRIFARTDRIRDEIFEKHGYVDTSKFRSSVTDDDSEDDEFEDSK